MPLSIMKKLGGDEKPTNMKLIMMDMSYVLPYGIMGDVIVKVGNFIFSVEFVILDIKEEEEFLIISGRPFILNFRANINLKTHELRL